MNHGQLHEGFRAEYRPDAGAVRLEEWPDPNMCPDQGNVRAHAPLSPRPGPRRQYTGPVLCCGNQGHVGVLPTTRPRGRHCLKLGGPLVTLLGPNLGAATAADWPARNKRAVIRCFSSSVSGSVRYNYVIFRSVSGDSCAGGPPIKLSLAARMPPCLPLFAAASSLLG